MAGPNWMTNLFNNENGFPVRPLHQITIPGTHDAGCYIDHGNYFNFLSRTQTETIGQQLTGGIRYFDIRPCKTGNNEFWTYHGMFYWGARLDGAGGILEQVRDFLNAGGTGNRELVILNISHFSKFNEAAHALLIQRIQATLGNHLVPHTQAELNLFNDPYQQVLTDRAGTVAPRVAILYDGALDTNKETYIEMNNLPAGFFKLSPKYNANLNAVNQVFLFDQYSNSAVMESDLVRTGVIPNQMKKLNERQKYYYTNKSWGNGLPKWTANGLGTTAVNGTMHLFSWTLTPQPYTDPITAANNDANPMLLDQFTDDNWSDESPYDPTVDKKINIIYADDYASETYAGVNVARQNLAMPVAISEFLNRLDGWTDWNAF